MPLGWPRRGWGCLLFVALALDFGLLAGYFIELLACAVEGPKGERKRRKGKEARERKQRQ
jgi:hypothetical protein